LGAEKGERGVGEEGFQDSLRRVMAADEKGRRAVGRELGGREAHSSGGQIELGGSIIQ